MMLSASEVQRVRCPQPKVTTKLGGLQVHRLGHVQRCELDEQVDMSALQNWIATFDRPDQTLSF